MISNIFNIAARSLDVYRKALDVTAHNIANADNENYTRQTANISTSFPDKVSGLVWGSGVQIDSITRIKDQFIESQYRKNSGENSFYNKQSDLLSRVEQVFTEPSEYGLSDLMTSFFNSWGELAVTPDSTNLRENVVTAAQNISTRVQTINQDLATIKEDTFNEFNSKVQTLNSLLSQIHELNVKITQQVGTGAQPNDLMDNRDALVNQVTSIADSQVYYDTKGSVNISIGGVLAVDLSQSIQFSVKKENGDLKLTTAAGHILQKIKGGELGAISDVYSSKIPDYLDKLDNIVSTLFNSVNGIHSKGYTNEIPPQTNINFFSSYEAGSLKINSEILDDPSKIAVSADGTTGNGDIALQIADLNNKQLINGSTLVDNYSSLITGVGNDKSSSDSLSYSSGLVLQQLDIQKSSVSGVSLDEEMSNVIKFQRSYDASAKLIAVADEMLQTLMQMV